MKHRYFCRVAKEYVICSKIDMPQTCQILLSSLASIFLLEKTVYYHEVDMKKDEKFFPQTKPLHNSDLVDL